MCATSWRAAGELAPPLPAMGQSLTLHTGCLAQHLSLGKGHAPHLPALCDAVLRIRG